MNGQNISQIEKYKQLNNTNNWNPCIPIKFYGNKSITITFKGSSINWYPLKICDYQNNSMYYKNEYLFDGGKSLIINNLNINNYTINNNTNYPIVRSIEYVGASIVINNGSFINISSTINNSLFWTRLDLHIKSTSFSNIQVSNSVFYGYHDLHPGSSTRSITFESDSFYNLSAAIMYQASKSDNDVK